MIKQRHNQYGFTLIELMISIVLGLLIILAALALFYGSTRGLKVQEAADDVQDAAAFSISYIQKEIAMANLGAYSSIEQTSPWTGIVFTGSIDNPEDTTTPKSQIGNLRGIGPGAPSISAKSHSGLVDYLTLTQVTTTDPNSNVKTVNSDGTAGPTINSDQLTIQYQAPFDMFDCEGNSRTKGQMVIERIFTRQDTSGVEASANNKIALACDAGWYDLNELSDATDSDSVEPNSITLNGLGSGSEVLVNRVDYMKVMVGVMLQNGIKYMTVSDYMTYSSATNDYTNKGPVVAVKLGIIARGTDPIGSSTSNQFTVLGQKVVIDNTDTAYARRVYESTIRLRNGD